MATKEELEKALLNLICECDYMYGEPDKGRSLQDRDKLDSAIRRAKTALGLNIHVSIGRSFIRNSSETYILADVGIDLLKKRKKRGVK